MVVHSVVTYGTVAALLMFVLYAAYKVGKWFVRRKPPTS